MPRGGQSLNWRLLNVSGVPGQPGPADQDEARRLRGGEQTYWISGQLGHQLLRPPSETTQARPKRSSEAAGRRLTTSSVPIHVTPPDRLDHLVDDVHPAMVADMRNRFLVAALFSIPILL
jgi:hypothetical protein